MANDSGSSDRLLSARFYDAHGDDYIADSLHIDMAPLYARFLPLVPAGGHILDAGCGSGRDSLAFINLGYRVTALDASAAMCRRAAQLTGQPVLQRSFQEIDWQAAFDGIWSCASLLHVPAAATSSGSMPSSSPRRPGGRGSQEARPDFRPEPIRRPGARGGPVGAESHPGDTFATLSFLTGATDTDQGGTVDGRERAPC